MADKNIIDQILWGSGPPPPEADRGTPALRVTVNLSYRTERALAVATHLREQTRTEVINVGVQLYTYVMALQANGGGIWVRDSSSGDLERLHIL